MIFSCLDPEPEPSFAKDINVSTKSTGGQVVLSCGYGREDCTELYRKIEQQEWDAVNHFLDYGNWPGLRFSLQPDIPNQDPKSQTRVVVSQYELHPNGNSERTSRLPLQEAIRKHAPFPVVRRLVDLYPDSVRWPDNKGSLAVHYALYYDAHDDVVAFLLLRYPDSVNKPNKLSLTPLQTALKADNNTRGLILTVFVYYTKLSADRHTDALSNPAMIPKKEFQCNYHVSCTPLYKKIEEGHWLAVHEFLTTGNFPSDSIFASWYGPEKVTPEQQAQTWVTRHDAVEGEGTGSYLPLHIAIIYGAPFSVTQRLIELYPQAVFCPDDQGMLPIHLALCHNAKDNLVAKLLLDFPDSVNIKCRNGHTPLDYALHAQDSHRGNALLVFVKATQRTTAKNTMTKVNL